MNQVHSRIFVIYFGVYTFPPTNQNGCETLNLQSIHIKTKFILLKYNSVTVSRPEEYLIRVKNKKLKWQGHHWHQTKSQFRFLLYHFKKFISTKKLPAAITNHSISSHLLEHKRVCCNFFGMQIVQYNS